VEIDIDNVGGSKAGGAGYKKLAPLKAGQCFGQMAMVEDKWGIEQAKASGDVVAMALDREQFVRVLGDDLDGLIKRGVDRKKLALIPFGKMEGPAENELDLLAGAIKERRFPKGHVFFTEGQSAIPALYLIREGKVSIRSSNHPNLESVLGFNLGDKEVNTIDNHGFFGNDTLGANEHGRFGLAMYTCVALEDVAAGVLDLDAIRSVAPVKVKTSISMENLDMVRYVTHPLTCL